MKTHSFVVLTREDLDTVIRDTAKKTAEEVMQTYAERHPRPPHINQKQAAAMLNISESTMSRMVKSGQIKLNKLGMIPISEIDRSLVANFVG